MRSQKSDIDKELTSKSIEIIKEITSKYQSRPMTYKLCQIIELELDQAFKENDLPLVSNIVMDPDRSTIKVTTRWIS